jgi:predicted  nucleic acid-binding Zn-ribbon protein
MANIARQEANYEKLCTTIERTQRRWEKADKAAARLLKKVAALERQRSRARRRLDRAKAEAQSAALHPEPELPKPESKDNGIPEFLDRSKKLQALPDPRTKEKKAERRAVEKEVKEAELRGKRRKMPLSGKDALKAIHSN